MEPQLRAFLDFQPQVRLEKQRRHQVLPRGHKNAAFFGTTEDSGLNGGGIIVRPVPKRAKIAHVKGDKFCLCSKAHFCRQAPFLQHFEMIRRVGRKPEQRGYHPIRLSVIRFIEAQAGRLIRVVIPLKGKFYTNNGLIIFL